MSATSSFPDIRAEAAPVPPTFALSPTRTLWFPRAVLSAARPIGWLIALVVISWYVAIAAHEIAVIGIAAMLPALLSPAFIEPVVGILPVNYVYATAMARFAAEIAPSGLAVIGDSGSYLASVLPGVFQSPDYRAGNAPFGAVIAPGSSLLARALVSAIANVVLLAIGLAVIARATRSATPRSLVDARGGAAAATIVGGTVIVEVASRVLRDFGSTRDLETVGVMPFIFHQVLRLPTETYDRFTLVLANVVDPGYQVAILAAALFGATALWRCAASLVGVRLHHLRTLATSSAAARGWQIETVSTSRNQRLIFDVVLVAVLVAAMPGLDYVTPGTRFLDWTVERVADIELVTPDSEVFQSELGATPIDDRAVAAESSPWSSLGEFSSLTIEPLEKGDILVPTQSLVKVARRYVPPPGPRPSVVTVAGQGLRYSYVVNGELAILKGMGYNVTHIALTRDERSARLRDDFAVMREAGVNTIVGWRTPEWDEALLDVAQASGLGVVMPWDFDEKLDYSDRAVRNRVKSDVLAWVARYRRHPAVHVWGLGNETLLHLRQATRARSFGEFYTELVDSVRAFDPDHPVMAREAEDVYVRWIQEPWRARGGPPAGFIVGMNFYTFRMRDAIEDWPKRSFDAPIVVSEFAPAGFGRVDRPSGYRRMWAMVRSRPDLILGVAPYVWSVDGPEPSDRIFGLTENSKAVDGSLNAIKDLYRAAAPADGWVTVPALAGARASDAEKILEDIGLNLVGVVHQRASDLSDASQVRRYGVGRVIHQEPRAGSKVQAGTEARLAISAAPLTSEWPIGRARED